MRLLKVMIIGTVSSFSEWVTVVAGGWNGTAPLATATMYRNGVTVALPDLPHAVYGPSLTVYKDKVRVWGATIVLLAAPMQAFIWTYFKLCPNGKRSMNYQ